MTPEMLDKACSTAAAMGQANVTFREGLLEDLPAEDAAADVVISSGVFNLCADKCRVFSEVSRGLRPGGHLQFADTVNGKPAPEVAIRDIDLWTA
jgi:ubiquinone/menaquinone biosynthesis C-methylase UbiE